MKFILTTTAKRKGAKRHKVYISTHISYLINNARFIDRNRYNVEIYNGKWELVKVL